ncbi:MAG TPA: succinate dehydrogenase, cytochrome b556 subunit [Ktedonobacteraceae bacterium]|nr:succinate dehydrogenase, cytochrome b556 subunit [Ktedonobacteraceae bacterium]
MEPFKHPGFYRVGRWFDLRRRKAGMWAYALNRITGIGLVVYLYLHLVVLSLLLGGPGSWNAFVSLARSPLVLVLDVILFAGALIHGLNGVRVALTSFSRGVRVQKGFFSVVMVVTVVTLAFVALKVFGG